MDQDSGQQDCTVYIEELKSDNPQSKNNAASKIHKIAQILGQQRTRQQLIPYIMEILLELDNQEQFLIKICQQLVILKQNIGGDQYMDCVIHPLQYLASLDYPAVRQKAIQNIQKFSFNQKKSIHPLPEFYESILLNLIKRMSSNQSYAPRISSVYLIHICYKQVSEKNKNILSEIFKKLSKDNIPMVRRAIAQCIVYLSDVVTRDWNKNEMVQIWSRLVQDSIDNVVIRCLQSTTCLTKYLSNEQISTKLYPLIEKKYQPITNWRTRYSIIECLTNIMQNLTQEVIESKVFDIFQSMIDNNQHEVKGIVLLKLPELMKKCSNNADLVDRMMVKLKQKAEDQSQYVRISLVQCICNIGKYVRKQTLNNDYMKIITKLFNDQQIIVRTTLLASLHLICSVIGNQNTKEFIMPMILNISNEKKWRFRLSIVEQLPVLFKQLGLNQFSQNIEQIINTFLSDHYFAIRQQCFKNFAKMKQYFGYEKTKQIVFKTITKLAKSPNYLYRITASLAVVQLKGVLEPKDLGDLFKQMCVKFGNDKISNVRYSILNTYIKVKGSLSNAAKFEFNTVLRKLKEDPDQQVNLLAKKVQE